MIPTEWLKHAPKPKELNKDNDEEWNVFCPIGL